MKAKSKAVARRKGPTNAVGDAVTSTATGVRSSPVFTPWENKATETIAKIRDRVKKSRAIQETLPFVKYMTQAIPEEALSGGLTPKSASKNEKFKKRATDLMWRWADSTAIDVRKRFDFYSIQAHLAATALGDGEVFIQKVRDDRPEARAWKLSHPKRRRLQVQYFTRDQLGDGNGMGLANLGGGLNGRLPAGHRWIDGLYFNDLDQWLTARILTKQKPGFIDRDADVMMHMFADGRLNQFHGDPWLFSSEQDALDELDMKALRKHSAKIRAAFLGAISTNSGEVPEAMKGFLSRGSDETDGSGDNQLRYFNLYGGAVMLPLKTEEKVEFYRGGEAMNFGQFTESLLSNIVYAFKYPPEYLINIGNNGSASNRLLLGKVKKAHARLRKMVRLHFIQEVWNFVIGDAMQPGGELAEFAGVEDWNQITCISEPDPSIDLSRDEKAEERRLQNFTGTVEEYCDSRNKDGAETRHQRLEEIADNISYGAAIRKPGVPKGLPWYLCVDPLTIQSVTSLAQTGGLTLDDLQQAFEENAGSQTGRA